MTLKSFLDSGHDEIVGVRIFVCVRTIAPQRTVPVRKTGKDIDWIRIGVFDDTAETILNLWADQTRSAQDWIPGKTILLVDDPECSSTQGNRQLREMKVGPRTLVEVEPEDQDSDWLRKIARSSKHEENAFVPFPPDVWDIGLAMCDEIRTLYTIAELDDHARDIDAVKIFGKLNVVITSLNLIELHQNNRLCCQEWYVQNDQSLKMKR